MEHLPTTGCVKKKGPEPVRIAREVYWKILRQRGYSYSRIARIFDYSHATIMSGVRRVNNLLAAKDALTTAMYNNIKSTMNMKQIGHIAMKDNRLFCTRCKSEYLLALPMELGDAAKRIEAFMMLHEGCEQI